MTNTVENMVVVTTKGLVNADLLQIKKQRDELLVEADALVNTALDQGIDEAPFRQYRQALRDIPQTFSDPETVTWPTKPSLPSASA